MDAAAAEEQDEPLPHDQWIKCGRCHEQFFCVVHRKTPTFVPMFCEACDAAMAPEQVATFERAREQLRRKLAAKKVSKKTMKSVIDAVISGVK